MPQVIKFENNLTMFVYPNSNIDKSSLAKIYKICQTAQKDKRVVNAELYSIVIDTNNTGSLIYQFFQGQMQILVLESPLGSALMGLSIINDIAIAPRRLYIDKNMKRPFSISKYVMPWLEQQFKAQNINYIVTSYHNSRVGNVYKKLLYKDKKLLKNNYFYDFTPIKDTTINFFHVDQFVVYKKLNDVADLTEEYLNTQLLLYFDSKQKRI
jgi:hypothetical protein